MPASVLCPFSTPADVADAEARHGRRQAVCRVVGSPAERDIHFAIRDAVFVAEQRVFADTDRDQRDEEPDTIHVLGLVGRMAVGAVRLYPLRGREGLWKGDRLAVLRRYRGHHVGGPLVRFAVATAARRGGVRMVARVQPPNVPFFEALGWWRDGTVVEYAGLPHQPMCIALNPPKQAGGGSRSHEHR